MAFNNHKSPTNARSDRFSIVNAKEKKAFRAKCRRRLSWDVMKRIKYGFQPANRPVLDEMPTRAFATMVEYREWCQRELPRSLGFWRPHQSSGGQTE
jgi:hypothetical protein